MSRKRLALILLIAVVSLFALSSTALAENGTIISPYAASIRW